MTLNEVLACVLLLCCFISFCSPIRTKIIENKKYSYFQKKLSDFINANYKILFAVVLVIGIWSRIYRFPEIPLGVHRDGTMSAVDAFALSKFGTDRFGTQFPVMLWGWGHGQQSALFAYIASIFVRLFGLSRLTMRLPMLTISLLSLPVVWDWTRRMWGKNAALLTLGLLSVTPWHIMQSRWAIDAHMLGHMILFSSYILYIGIHKRPFLYLSMVLFGLSMYAYVISFFAVPLLLIASGMYLVINRKIKWKQFFICASIYLIVILPLVITMVINILDLQTIQLGPLTLQRFSESDRMTDILFFSEKSLLEQIQINISAFFNNTFFQKDLNLPYGIPQYGLFYLFATPLYMAALPYFWRKRRTKQLSNLYVDEPESTGGYIILMWYLSMIICCLITNNTSVWRANGIYYPMIITVSYLLYKIIYNVKLLVIPVCLCFAIGFISFECTYFSNEVINKGGEAFLSGQYDAIEYVKTLPYEHLYISTGDTEESDFKTIAEVKILLSHQIDAEQFMNKKELLDKEGSPIGYYRDIYDYWTSDDGDFWADPEENAAYILWEWDIDQFDPDLFFIKQFDRWAVAYPRQMLP